MMHLFHPRKPTRAALAADNACLRAEVARLRSQPVYASWLGKEPGTVWVLVDDPEDGPEPYTRRWRSWRLARMYWRRHDDRTGSRVLPALMADLARRYGYELVGDRFRCGTCGDLVDEPRRACGAPCGAVELVE